MPTAFKQVADNAHSTTSTDLSLTGVTSIVLPSGDGAKFPQPGNGFIATIWNGVLYPTDPALDPNMEKVVVSARSIDTLTTAPTTKTHTGIVTVALLDVAQNTIDLQTAVNTAEASIATNTAAISSEASARASADTTLQGNITAETSRATAAEATKAPLASPAFSGSPTAPTALPATSTSQVATTAFVEGEIVANATPNATPSSKGIVQLAGDLGGSAAGPKAKHTASIIVAPYGSTEAADYTCASATGNQTEINAAIAAASALSTGGTVYLKAGTYTMTSTVTPRSNVTLRGEGPATILKINANSYIILTDTTALTDFGLQDLTFLGDNTTAHAKGAIYLNGDLYPSAVSPATITNFTMRNCTVKNTTSLPISVFGVGGKTMVTGCEFNQCLDAGFIYDSEVIFIGNHSIGSGDNGFSISRGCQKVTCVGNTVEGATFYGIWCSGFLGAAGPTDFTISGNTVKSCRNSGIALIGSPTNGSVTGNFIDQGHNRPSDSNIDGIQIYGDNTTTQYAYNIAVSGNTILNAARAGISVNNAKNISITDNLIVNAGTQYLADGSTAITATDQTTNIGIFSSHLTNTNIWIDGNTIIDDRSTPYCNYDIWKIQSTTAGFTLGQNYSTGMRTDRNRLDLTNVAVEAGNDVALSMNGPDTDINLNLNMQGAGQLRVRGTGDQFNINNTSASSSARTSLRLSAGATTAVHGMVSATRQDASSSSLIALRPLTNSSLMGSDTTAALYYQGLPSNSMGFMGFNGGLRASRRTVADISYSVLLLDYIVAYTSLTIGRTATLPTAVAVTGQTYIVKDETGTAGTNNITIATTSAQTIDGVSTKVININYGMIIVYSDGANWRVQGGVYNASQFPTLNQDTTGKAAKTDALTSATTIVDVSAATAPTIGQVLTAVDSTHATWQPPAGGAPSGTAGGDLSGTYPNPAVAAAHLTAASTIADAVDIGLGTTTGTKIGTATSQKLGFFNATPVVQQTAATDLGTMLANLGLRAAGATYTLSTSGTSAFTGSHSLTGSQRALGVSRTGAVTLASTSSTNNECDATSAAFTITLPSVTGNAGVLFEFIKTDSSANAVTVGTTSSQTINGSTTYALATQYKRVGVRANAAGTAWLIVDSN